MEAMASKLEAIATTDKMLDKSLSGWALRVNSAAGHPGSDQRISATAGLRELEKKCLLNLVQLPAVAGCCRASSNADFGLLSAVCNY